MFKVFDPLEMYILYNRVFSIVTERKYFFFFGRVNF